MRVENLDAFPLLGSYFKKFSNPVIIAPDKGALGYAKHAASVAGCGFDYLEKIRVSDDKVEIRVKGLDVSAKDVVILDDVSSTGGTVIEAARAVKKQGAGSVSAGCVHGLFTKGLGIFEGAVDELVCTDTIETKVSRVGVAGLLADSL